MSKSTVIRVFIGGVLAVIAGATVAVASVWIGIVNDVFVMNGPDIVGIQGSALAWVLIGVGIAGAVALAGGLVAGFVSWIGALLNTSRLESRTWFLVLLLLGIFNFGFFAMIAYVIAGPDGMTAVASRRGQAPASA